MDPRHTYGGSNRTRPLRPSSRDIRRKAKMKPGEIRFDDGLDASNILNEILNEATKVMSEHTILGQPGFDRIYHTRDYKTETWILWYKGEKLVVTDEFLFNNRINIEDLTRQMRGMVGQGITMQKAMMECVAKFDNAGRRIKKYGPRMNPINTSRAFIALADDRVAEMQRDEIFKHLDLPYSYVDILQFMTDAIHDMMKWMNDRQSNTTGALDFGDPNVMEQLTDMVVLLLATMFKEVELAADETF